jgi:hypothetical protein
MLSAYSGTISLLLYCCDSNYCPVHFLHDTVRPPRILLRAQTLSDGAFSHCIRDLPFDLARRLGSEEE